MQIGFYFGVDARKTQTQEPNKWETKLLLEKLNEFGLSMIITTTTTTTTSLSS